MSPRQTHAVSRYRRGHFGKARRPYRLHSCKGELMSTIAVSATINGDDTEFLCRAEETLLEVLRDRLGLTGAKEGCGTGDCGACSTIMYGRVVCACLGLGAEVERRTIETIESMANGHDLHPLQSKFIEHAAL